MKTVLIIISIMGLFQFLFGCKQIAIESKTLYGDWEAVKLNKGPIEDHGFISIKMQISKDSIHILTQMKTFGDVTTISEGTWELKDQKFIANFGGGFQESRIDFIKNNLIFTPDPLFKTETVFESEYKKVQK